MCNVQCHCTTSKCHYCHPICCIFHAKQWTQNLTILLQRVTHFFLANCLLVYTLTAWNKCFDSCFPSTSLCRDRPCSTWIVTVYTLTYWSAGLTCTWLHIYCTGDTGLSPSSLLIPQLHAFVGRVHLLWNKYGARQSSIIMPWSSWCIYTTKAVASVLTISGVAYIISEFVLFGKIDDRKL